MAALYAVVTLPILADPAAIFRTVEEVLVTWRSVIEAQLAVAICPVEDRVTHSVEAGRERKGVTRILPLIEVGALKLK